MQQRYQLLQRRKQRVRTRIRATNAGRPRLTVSRTNLHIYVQVIDDQKAETIVAASSVTQEFKKGSKLKNGGNKLAARFVGEMIAKSALAKGIKDVVFDRSGLLYHGRVKELAEAARQGGLNF
ncbi:MAG: 50S ribosomal protein L18 [Alphaproteobacteria bacterium]